MSDTIENNNIVTVPDGVSEMPASCFGVWGRDYYATAADENVYHFLDYYRRTSLMNLIHPEDELRFSAWWNSLDATRQRSIIVKMIRGNGEMRTVYMKGRAVDDGENKNLLNIEMIDVERTCESFSELSDMITRITAYHEHLEGCEFEYDAADGTVSMFRFISSSRKAETDPGLVGLVPELAERFKRIKGKPEIINEIIQGPDDNAYSIDAICLYRHFELSGIYGRVRKNNQRYEDVEKTPIENIDSFTGLWNKVGSLEYLRQALEDKDVHQVVVFMLDIDYFKTLNDSYGHAFGDEAILRTAQIIKGVIKNRGIGARFGGDEFMVVLKDLGPESAIRAVAESIRTQISWAFPEKVLADRITCTIGISEAPRNGTDFDTIFNKADRALYIGKQKGKNRYIIYKEQLHGELPTSSDISLEQGIRDALNVDTLLNKITSCLKILSTEGREGLQKVASKLLPLYGMERLSIYTGEELSLLEFYGLNEPPVQSLAGFKRKEAEGLLDKYGICQIAFAYDQPIYLSDIHDRLKSNGVKDIAVFAHTNKGKIDALVCFERLTRRDTADSRKWSDEELHFLTLVSRMIAESVTK